MPATDFGRQGPSRPRSSRLVEAQTTNLSAVQLTSAHGQNPAAIPALRGAATLGRNEIAEDDVSPADHFRHNRAQGDLVPNPFQAAVLPRLIDGDVIYHTLHPVGLASLDAAQQAR